MPLKSFVSSFDDLTDFSNKGYYFENGFSIAPGQEYELNTRHSQSRDTIIDGRYCHKSWITTNNGPDNEDPYLPHRAYPTIQMYKDNGNTGAFTLPSLTTFYARTDMQLRSRAGIDDWLSLATLCSDPGDTWYRTVLANITTDGYLRLVHVPDQGQQTYIYQITPANNPSGSLKFTRNVWHRIDMYVDFRVLTGCAMLWQNKKLMSVARVYSTYDEINYETLAQAHFGLYASEAVAKGTVYNDKLRMTEVDSFDMALNLVNDNW